MPKNKKKSKENDSFLSQFMIQQKGADGLNKKDIKSLTKGGIGFEEVLKVAGNNGLLFSGDAVNKYGISQVQTGTERMPGGRSPKSGGLGYKPVNTYSYRASAAPGAMTAAAQEQSPAPEPVGPIDQWSQSIDSGTQSILDSLNQTIQENQKNQELYMGMYQGLLAQMNAGQQAAAAPYTVTTPVSPGAAAQTSQVTQQIARRPRLRNSTLSIAPMATTSGTGLNIAA